MNKVEGEVGVQGPAAVVEGGCDGFSAGLLPPRGGDFDGERGAAERDENALTADASGADMERSGGVFDRTCDL